MNLLVIGSGGREHALVWKLCQSPHARKIYCAPGNAGIALEQTKTEPVDCVSISADDLPTLASFAKEKQIDLTVVGPDNPLALGIVDLFQRSGLRIWGPNKQAAQFEGSKAFSQRFMERHGVPTAESGTFSNAAEAKLFAEKLRGRCAVKADGLALGKGVLLCQNTREASEAIDEMLVQKAFGAAGSKIVIQELLEGREISLHALCDGKTAKLFPTAQDHKRALDGDQGLNTGGMGAYSPTPFLTDFEFRDLDARILAPWMKGCEAEQIDFRGILYPGIMLTPKGPKVLEFNARFGDPEAQVYLTRLESDLIELLEASISGTLSQHDIRWSPNVSCCVVLASGGYPGAYPKGKEITGLNELSPEHGKIFHAGTAKHEGKMVTNGGRVLGVTAWAPTLCQAQKLAYDAVESIKFDGMQYRRDIGRQGISEKEFDIPRPPINI